MFGLFSLLSFGNKSGAGTPRSFSIGSRKHINKFEFIKILRQCIYEIMVIPFNARLLQLISRLKNSPDDVLQAKGLFRWSILYMFGICLLLLIARTNISVQFEEQTLLIARSIFSKFSDIIGT